MPRQCLNHTLPATVARVTHYGDRLVHLRTYVGERKSFVDDLSIERGTVSVRVALCYDPLRFTLCSTDLFAMFLSTCIASSNKQHLHSADYQLSFFPSFLFGERNAKENNIHMYYYYLLLLLYVFLIRCLLFPRDTTMKLLWVGNRHKHESDNPKNPQNTGYLSHISSHTALTDGWMIFSIKYTVCMYVCMVYTILACIHANIPS